MSVTTMLLNEDEPENLDVHTLTFDEHRTILAGDKRFFFVKRVYAETGKVLSIPVTSIVSYPIGTGVPLDWQ